MKDRVNRNTGITETTGTIRMDIRTTESTGTRRTTEVAKRVKTRRSTGSSGPGKNTIVTNRKLRPSRKDGLSRIHVQPVKDGAVGPPGPVGPVDDKKAGNTRGRRRIWKAWVTGNEGRPTASGTNRTIRTKRSTRTTSVQADHALPATAGDKEMGAPGATGPPALSGLPGLPGPKLNDISFVQSKLNCLFPIRIILLQ